MRRARVSRERYSAAGSSPFVVGARRGPSPAATVLRAAAVALAWLVAGACGRGRPEPCSVLLVTLDTTRWDAPGALGGRPGVTPRLDELARESVVYANARTVSPLTMPSHASILTGLYPPRHGVRDNNVEPVPDSAVTLAERAREAGFQTAAFVSSIAVDSAFGFGQGFECFDEPGREAQQVLSHAGARAARDTVAAARAWLARRDPARPFFVWVHLYDPHAPYEPERRYQDQAGGNAYLGEVAATDAALGELVDELRADGGWARTFLVVVADHGEALGDHDESTHGAYVYDATIRVPLWIRHPDGWRAGEVSDEVVSVADVFPTALEALGLAPPGDVDGRSLFHREVPPGRGVYFESYYGFLYYGWSPLVGWADEHLAYVQGSVPRVFSATRRNGAGRRVKPDDPLDVEPYRAALRELLARPALARAQEAAPELLARLQDLGYAAAAEVPDALPSPFDPAVLDLPDPHERKEEHAETLRGMNLAKGPLNDQAIALLEPLVRANPHNVVARGRLADCYVYAGRWEEAITALEAVLASGRAAPGVWANLGIALFETGRRDRAEEALRAALAADPAHVQAMIYLLQVVEARGDTHEADELRAKIARSEEERDGAAERR